MSNNFSDLSQLNGNLFSHMSFNQKRKLMYNWHVIPYDVIIKESWDFSLILVFMICTKKKTETVSSKTTVPDSMLCISYKIMFQIINFQVVDAS